MRLDVQNLGKQFKSGQWGLRGCSFAFDGGVVGVVGPVGSGKTTLLRLLATVMLPTEGQALWDGTDVRRQLGHVRRNLGYLPQDFGVYTSVPARQFLAYLAATKGLAGRQICQRVDQILSDLGLSECAGQVLSRFSPEMRRRVGLAQALLADPLVLLIDEPGAGLSPRDWTTAQTWLFRATKVLNANRCLVLIATNDIAQIADLASAFLLLAEGQVIAQTTADEMLRRARSRVWQVEVDQTIFSELRSRYLISGLEREQNLVRLRIISDVQPLPSAVQSDPTLTDAYYGWIGGRQ
ncbi:MAG: ATP-binding cassette domain-containing protein [Anaerolineae bacterium]|nr:ATP-binding cassette domain-containing protein [Anaerolineae bacterium]